jgi:hypothetical protein
MLEVSFLLKVLIFPPAPFTCCGREQICSLLVHPLQVIWAGDCTELYIFWVENEFHSFALDIISAVELQSSWF